LKTCCRQFTFWNVPRKNLKPQPHRAKKTANETQQQRIVAKVDELMRWCDALEGRLTAASPPHTPPPPPCWMPPSTKS
jgi:hypothetical protein